MSNGIRSLPRYQGGARVPPDTPGTGASRVFAKDDVSERRRQQWDESQRWAPPGVSIGGGGGAGPMFLGQWARDILGEQVRDRLGLETLGNWIGASDITAGDLSRREFEALQRAALQGMLREGRGRETPEGTEWSVQYPDYDVSLTDPERATNKAFERIFGGYGIDYDYPGWDYKGIRGDEEAIDALVESSGGWNFVSNPGSPLATQTAAGKGPAIGPTGTGLISLPSGAYKVARGIAGLIPRFTDPAAGVMQTFGRGQVIRDPDTGNYYFKDRYNWNNRQAVIEKLVGDKFNPFSREDWGSLREDLGESEGVYDLSRTLSEYFGSPSGEGREPEGSFVRINLGQLDDLYLDEAGQLADRSGEDLEQEREVLAQNDRRDVDYMYGKSLDAARRAPIGRNVQVQEGRPSGLRRGIGWLGERVGGLLDRYRGVDERVAETGDRPVDEISAELEYQDAMARLNARLRDVRPGDPPNAIQPQL